MICKTCIKVDSHASEASARFRSWARIEGRLTSGERREKEDAHQAMTTADRLKAAHRKVCKAHAMPTLDCDDATA